jgi:ribosomal protein L19
MTEAQAKFVELEKRKEEVKKYFDDLNIAVEAVAKEIGVNGFFQDGEGTVYQVVVPEGKFVYFEKLSYLRTRRFNEKRGDLSMEKAKAAGFALPNRE